MCSSEGRHFVISAKIVARSNFITVQSLLNSGGLRVVMGKIFVSLILIAKNWKSILVVPLNSEKLLTLSNLYFKHNRGHSWAMLPITVDFLFDGRNTRFRNKTTGTCVEGRSLHSQVLEENDSRRSNIREICES